MTTDTVGNAVDPGDEDSDPPLVIPPFDPDLHCAPLTLFGRLRAGSPPLLLDLRSEPSSLHLLGAVSWRMEPWPFGHSETVLVDEDGVTATATATTLRAAGRHHVRALYGGLRLYSFTLHPAVVPQPHFLIGPRFLDEYSAAREP